MTEHTRYARLAKISQLINSSLDLRSVLESVATVISEEVMQCNSVGIYLPEPDGTFRGYVGKPAVLNGITLNQLVIDPAADQLVREIIASCKPVYIPDTAVDNRPDPRSVSMFQIKSLFGLPIAYENDLYGLVFLFDYGLPMNLTQAQMQAVEAYVNMAAVAIRNGNQLHHITTLLTEKQILLDAARELALCSTAQEILDTSFRFVGQVLKNTNIGVHLCDSIGKKFRPAKMNPHSEWSEEEWQRVHRKIQLNYEADLLFQEVVQTQKAVFIADVEADPRPNREACRQFGIRSIFMLPLVAASEVLGTIAVVSLGQPQAYSEQDMLLAQSLVDTTATALANAIRMEQLELIIAARTAELRERNKLFELILNSAGEGIYGLNLQKAITFCNPAAAEILGYEPAELIGALHADICLRHRPEADTSEKPIAENADAGCAAVHKTAEGTFKRKNGTLFPVEFVSTPILEDDAVVGEVIVFRDITERKHAEEIILKTEKLSIVGELAAGVAHEIRNPLTTLRGFIQLLQAQPGGKQNNLEIMLSELDRINFIVSELLFLAKPMETSLQRKDLTAIMDDVITLLNSQAILSNVQIRKTYPPEIPYALCAENQLKQAFINILKNAIESMPGGGIVRIEMEAGRNRQLLIRFIDQGGGIPWERRAKLGEPFYTTKEKGFGLGLMVTHRIIKLHHGSIRFDSDGRTGTTVEVVLPQVQPAAKSC